MRMPNASDVLMTILAIGVAFIVLIAGLGVGGIAVALAAQSGTSVPAFMSALAYYDGYRTARLPANLLQAQRDYFGAHTYRRIDREGTFHTDWSA